MKTRLNSAKYTRLSKSKQSDQPCDPSVEVVTDKKQPYVKSARRDKQGNIFQYTELLV